MDASYLDIADDIAKEIAEGRLRPGERLLPQREFAYRRRIAVSTAGRAYAELGRRGLVVGETGRGTFVRKAAPAPADRTLVETGTDGRVDLELNFPVLPEQAAMLGPSLMAMSLPDALRIVGLGTIGAAGTERVRSLAADMVAQPGWRPSPDSILFAGSGRQCIAAALAALAGPGDRIGVEALTYPVIKGLAKRLGLTLVPLQMDRDGLRPDALEAAHRHAPLRGVYVQTTLHNPLGTTMPMDRRQALATLLERLGLTAVEDVVYGFLHDASPLPLAALAPRSTILVDSLSKRVAPGLTAGVIVSPSNLVDALAAALRTGSWMSSAFALEATARWLEDGTVMALVERKRRDAATRQTVARKSLDGLDLTGDAKAYHVWLSLPDRWRTEELVAACAFHGIAITPGSAFAVGRGQSPNAVRLALASPPLDVLPTVLDAIYDIVTGVPPD